MTPLNERPYRMVDLWGRRKVRKNLDGTDRPSFGHNRSVNAEETRADIGLQGVGLNNLENREHD